MGTEKKINIYGDSIMLATALNENGRYHSQAKPLLKAVETDYHRVIKNRARFGFTSQRGVTIVNKDIEKGELPDVALIEYGGNDCDFNWGEIAQSPDTDHTPYVPVEFFVKNLKEITFHLLDAGVEPILMTLPPIDGERYFEHVTQGMDSEAVLSYLGDKQMIPRWQGMYSDAIFRFALEHSIKIIDVRSYFLGRRDFKSLVGPDGIHLTQKGYELMAHAFRRYLSDGSWFVAPAHALI